MPGSVIAERVEREEFEMMDEDAIVREIRLLIDSINDASSRLVSDHDRNLLMEVEGEFPYGKAAMLETIDNYLGLSDRTRLLFRIGRRFGFFRVLDDLNNPTAIKAAEEAMADLTRRFGDPEAGLYKVIKVTM